MSIKNAQDNDSAIFPDEKMDGKGEGVNWYKFGFNGKEQDDEVKGFGSQQDYGMRVYDPRAGRFLSLDPLQKKFPFYTPYSFAGNKPIWAVDLDGREDYKYNLVLSENSKGETVLKIQYAGRDKKPNLIERTILGLNEIGDRYELWYNGEQVGLFNSEHEMNLIAHGKTVDQLKELEADRIFKGAAVIAILHAYETVTAPKGGRTGGGRAASTAAEEEAAVARTASSKAATEADPMTAAMSRPLTGPLPSLGKNTVLTVDEAIAGKVTAKITSAQPNGRNFTFSIDNNAIKFADKSNKAGWYDFVIMKNGELRIGSGHWYLSKGAKNITGAGQVYIDDAGKIGSVTNNTGHYRTNQTELINAARTFKRNGVATDDIHVVDVTK